MGTHDCSHSDAGRCGRNCLGCYRCQFTKRNVRRRRLPAIMRDVRSRADYLRNDRCFSTHDAPGIGVICGSTVSACSDQDGLRIQRCGSRCPSVARVVGRRQDCRGHFAHNGRTHRFDLAGGSISLRSAMAWESSWRLDRAACRQIRRLGAGKVRKSAVRLGQSSTSFGPLDVRAAHFGLRLQSPVGIYHEAMKIRRWIWVTGGVLLLSYGCMSPSFVRAQTQVARSGQQDGSSCRRFVQEFYDWYVPFTQANVDGRAMDIALQRKAPLFHPDLARALKIDSAAQSRAKGELVGIDFDPFLGSQDPADHYEARLATMKANKCSVEVRPASPGDTAAKPGKADVVAELSFVGARWEFQNFRYPAVGADLVSVLAGLREERRRH